MNYRITKAEFVKSSTELSQCPASKDPEFAFIGRSNVGKSSLINMLCGAAVAKTSSTPGKTQTINHFRIDERWFLADLPGYGYAKVSQTQRARWDGMIRSYLLKRENLALVFLLLDTRINPMASDIEFLAWLGKNQIPVALVFTKCDKLKPAEVEKNVEVYKNKIMEQWEEMPTYFLTSSEKQLGKDELSAYIDTIVNSAI